MKRNRVLFLIFVGMSLLFTTPAHALSVRHHLKKTINRIIDVPSHLVKGVFVYGPKKAVNAYRYEAYEREKVEERGLLRYKLFGLWRLPGEEAKGIVEGVTKAVDALGAAVTEVLSIVFSD